MGQNSLYRRNPVLSTAIKVYGVEMSDHVFTFTLAEYFLQICFVPVLHLFWYDSHLVWNKEIAHSVPRYELSSILSYPSCSWVVMRF